MVDSLPALTDLIESQGGTMKQPASFAAGSGYGNATGFRTSEVSISYGNN
jgi:hypothetical protein